MLNNINIAATKSSPLIKYDSSENLFLIKGKAIPENVNQLFKPVLEWIELFGNSDVAEVNFTFYFSYFNTTTSKVVFQIIRDLKKIRDQKNKKVTISWIYDTDDEDMKDMGEMYHEHLGDIVTLSEGGGGFSL